MSVPGPASLVGNVGGRSLPLWPSAFNNLYSSRRLPEPKPSSLFIRMLRPVEKPARANADPARSVETRIVACDAGVTMIVAGLILPSLGISQPQKGDGLVEM